MAVKCNDEGVDLKSSLVVAKFNCRNGVMELKPELTDLLAKLIEETETGDLEEVILSGVD